MEKGTTLGAVIKNQREALGINQRDLAKDVGINNSTISRIENNASDIRLSTLMRIIQEGLGGHLKLSVDL